MVFSMRVIEDLIKPLSDKLDDTYVVQKYNGITLMVKSQRSVDAGMAEVKSVCKKLKITGFSIEKNMWDEESFLLQFPDFVPEYNDEEIYNMYVFNFKWLLDNLKQNQDGVIDKSSVLNGKEQFIRNAIQTYCRSNINPYKENADTYLNDIDYRRKLAMWFEQVLATY